jgi:hypothetical protein
LRACATNPWRPKCGVRRAAAAPTKRVHNLRRHLGRSHARVVRPHRW